MERTVTGAQLAAEFDESNRSFIAAIERLTEDEWKTRCENGTWTVGQVAYHMADACEAVMGFIRDALTEDSITAVGFAWVEERNEASGARSAHYDRGVVLDALRATGVKAFNLVRGLSEEDLAAEAVTFEGKPLTVENAVRGLLIGHGIIHLQDIRGAVEGVRAH